MSRYPRARVGQRSPCYCGDCPQCGEVRECGSCDEWDVWSRRINEAVQDLLGAMKENLPQKNLRDLDWNMEEMRKVLEKMPF